MGCSSHPCRLGLNFFSAACILGHSRNCTAVLPVSSVPAKVPAFLRTDHPESSLKQQVLLEVRWPDPHPIFQGQGTLAANSLKVTISTLPRPQSRARKCHLIIIVWGMSFYVWCIQISAKMCPQCNLLSFSVIKFKVPLQLSLCSMAEISSR